MATRECRKCLDIFTNEKDLQSIKVNGMCNYCIGKKVPSKIIKDVHVIERLKDDILVHKINELIIRVNDIQEWINEQ